MTANTELLRNVTRLAKDGITFTLPKRGERNPYTKGWPSHTPSLDEVKSHLQDGHNLGIHTANLPYFDGDDANGLTALLAIAPELQTSLRSWREKGSGKIFFRTDGDLYQQATGDLDGPHTKRELKTSGQAAIYGIHPSGEAYQTNWQLPVFLPAERVVAIWEQWTGQEYREKANNPRPQTAPTFHPTHTPDDGGLVSQLRAYWTAYAVFEHHGRIAEVLEGESDWKLRGNGGLYVGNPGGPDSWRWYCFADSIGGDAFDAWNYCTRKRVLDRANKAEFLATLREMAEATGLDFDGPDDNPLRIVNPDTGEILDADRLAVTGRGLLTGRTKRTDAAAWDAVLKIMLSNGTSECPLSTRHIADLAGISQSTAGWALGRLVEAGLLERVSKKRGFVDAYVYRLTDAIPHFESHNRQVGGDCSPCDSKWGIADEAKAETARELLFSPELEDAWRYSRRGQLVTDRDTGELTSIPTPKGAGLGSLGHSGRELLATLDAYGTGNFSQLAEWAGMGNTTVSRLADYLSQLGLVDVVEQGRAKLVSLVDDWRDRLADLVPSMVTTGKSRGQRLKHARERIERAERYIRTTRGRGASDAARGIIDRAKRLQAALGDSVRAFSGHIRDTVHDIRNHPPVSREDVLQERRTIAYEGLIRRANVLLSGGLFTDYELAEMRGIVGRLGMDLTAIATIDTGGGYTFAYASG